MKKGVLAVLFTGILWTIGSVSVLAAAVNEPSQTENIVQESTTEVQETVTEEEETTQWILPQGNIMVEVDTINLSLHKESSGEFSPVYAYENPFLGRDTSDGVILEFYVKPNWEIHELGTIFAFCGSGEYEGRLYFTPGSYLGFNSEAFGGYFDANLYNYTLVTDYIKNGAKIRIELLPSGFLVYADDVLCYDQTILSDETAGNGDFTPDSDFGTVLAWLSRAQVLYFGYGSWWNMVGVNEANMELSQVNFRLQDGTVVFDQLKVDQELVESLGGTVNSFESPTAGIGSIELAEVSVEIFDINSVEYEGGSVFPIMAAAVGAVAVLAAVLIVYALKERNYEEV